MLTKRQKQILDFVKTSSKKNGYSPSLEEIAKHFKLNSVATIHEHMQRLQDKGYLKKQKNQKRSAELLRKTERMIQVPLLGVISAGQPIESLEQREIIAVPQSKFPSSGKVFALKVAGDSMIEENIHDGDIILVKHQNTAENGDKIVALIDNYNTTLKTYYKENGHIRLQPANNKMKPIIVKKGTDFKIQGVFIDIFENEKNLNFYQILTPKMIKIVR